MRVSARSVPGPLAAEAHRADRGAHQPLHRVPDLGQQPPHDVLAPLVQDHLDDRPRRRARTARPGTVHPRRAVVELDARAQPPAQPGRPAPATVAR